MRLTSRISGSRLAFCFSSSVTTCAACMRVQRGRSLSNRWAGMHRALRLQVCWTSMNSPETWCLSFFVNAIALAGCSGKATLDYPSVTHRRCYVTKSCCCFTNVTGLCYGAGHLGVMGTQVIDLACMGRRRHVHQLGVALRHSYCAACRHSFWPEHAALYRAEPCLQGPQWPQAGSAQSPAH